MSKRTLYLGGPILDCTRGEANDWRGQAALALRQRSIVGISPLRCEPLVGDRYDASYQDPCFGTPRAITSKNMQDVKMCDMILAYLPKPAEGRHQSYGTIAELSWAFALGKPAILVTDDPEVLRHPVLTHSAGWIVGTLDEGLDIAIGILADFTH